MEEFDFLVIGAGIAGLSAAARLARHGRVLVCEAETAPGFHSSGRSAAFAHFDMESLLVRALTAASLPLFEEPQARSHPALFIALEGQSDALAQLEANYRQWQPRIAALDTASLLELVPALRENLIEGGLLDPHALKLDAHAMLEAHRRELANHGGILALKARVLGLQRRGDGWIVECEEASYVAKTVINASGAWADEVARLAGVEPLGLIPLRRTVITFDVAANMDVASWPFTKTVGAGFYLEPEGRGRLLACPMDEGASAPCDAQPEEEDVATAAWRIEQATTLSIPRLASKWAGLRTFTPDRLPVAGFAADSPGFFWLAGQGGFGLQTSPAMALATEALVTNGPWPQSLVAVGVKPDQLNPARLA